MRIGDRDVWAHVFHSLGEVGIMGGVAGSGSLHGIAGMAGKERIVYLCR